MYNISEFYREKINTTERNWLIKCEVKRNRISPSVVTLEGDDLISNTFKISGQSSNSSSFTLGGVCSTKINLTLTYEGVAKMKQFDMLHQSYCLEVNVWLKTDDPNQSDTDWSKNKDDSENTTGKVPFGYFYIYTIKNADYICELELYDAMLAFDTDITAADAIYLYQGAKNISDWFEFFCESCTTLNYKLVVAEGLHDRIINNETLFYIGEDSTLKTYREAIGYLSILAGGFAVITRNGELDIVEYKISAQLNIPSKFVVDYKADDTLYKVARISTSIAGFDYTAYSSHAVLEDEAAEIFLDENPFLRGIQPMDAEFLDDKIKDIINNIMLNVEDVSFYGGSFSIVGRPELDCGDCLTINVDTLDKSTDTVVTKTYNNVLICSNIWSYQTWSDLKCNSYLNVTSRGKSSSQSKKSSGDAKSKAVNSISHFIGTELVELHSGETLKIFDIVFTSFAYINSAATVTITLRATQAGDISFRFVYDADDYWTKPKYTLHEGYNTLSFTIGLKASDIDRQHSLGVYITSMESIVSNIRSEISRNYDNIIVLDRRVTNLEDKTPNHEDINTQVLSHTGVELTIQPLDYQILINASGINNGEEGWTGRYDLEDRLPRISVGTNNPVVYEEVEDEVSVDLNV